jgi:hypothetical protein
MMTDEINPYASPAIVNGQRPTEETAAISKLRGPSLGLLLLGGFVAIFGIAVLPLMLLAALLVLLFPTFPKPNLDTLFVVPMFLASYPIVYGAWKMRYGNSYRWAYAAAVLTCIPVLSPFVYFGIPVGIWALIVLHRKDVKAAFAAKAAEKTTTPKNAVS